MFLSLVSRAIGIRMRPRESKDGLLNIGSRDHRLCGRLDGKRGAYTYYKTKGGVNKAALFRGRRLVEIGVAGESNRSGREGSTQHNTDEF